LNLTQTDWSWTTFTLKKKSIQLNIYYNSIYKLLLSIHILLFIVCFLVELYFWYLDFILKYEINIVNICQLFFILFFHLVTNDGKKNFGFHISVCISEISWSYFKLFLSKICIAINVNTVVLWLMQGIMLMRLKHVL